MKAYKISAFIGILVLMFGEVFAGAWKMWCIMGVTFLPICLIVRSLKPTVRPAKETLWACWLGMFFIYFWSWKLETWVLILPLVVAAKLGIWTYFLHTVLRKRQCLCDKYPTQPPPIISKASPVKMTIPQWKAFLEILDDYLFNEKDWRLGQCYFNAAYAAAPEVADQYRASDLDPFHCCDRRLRFAEAIAPEGIKVDTLR